MNRKWMPKADTSTWTPLEYIAEYVEVVVNINTYNTDNTNLHCSGYFING